MRRLDQERRPGAIQQRPPRQPPMRSLRSARENDEPLLPPHLSSLIWWSAWLSVAAAFLGIRHGFYDLALCPGGVAFTSLLYWRDPRYGWRRNLDITYVQLALWYEAARMLDAEEAVRMDWVAAMVLAGVFFALSFASHTKRPALSAFLHVCGHCLANVANAVAFSSVELPHDPRKAWFAAPGAFPVAYGSAQNWLTDASRPRPRSPRR